MRLFPAGISMLVVLRVARANSDSVENLSMEDLSLAQCDNQVIPLANTDGQNPCQVAVELLTPCNITNSNRPVISTPCTCNLVYYNLFSACSSLCLQQGVVDYDLWIARCPGTSAVTNYYPFKSDQISVGDGTTGVDIPSWAEASLSSGGSFDAENAFSSQTDNKGWTLIQKLAPVIAVVGVLLIVLLTWYLRVWHRRRRNRAKNPIHALDHQPSHSLAPMNSHSHLAHRNSEGAHLHRAWIFLGGLFKPVTPVREKQRDTVWTIDNDEGHRMQDYDFNNPDGRYQDPPPERLAPNRAPGRHLHNRSVSSDFGDPPGSSRRDPSSPSWWSREWLHKFGSTGKTPRRTKVPKGKDYISANVSSLQRKSGFRIDIRDDGAGLGLLHAEEVHGLGSMGTSSSPPPSMNPHSPWNSLGRAGAIDLTKKQGAHRMNRDAEDGSVILISRLPGVDFPSDESAAEGSAHSWPGIRIQQDGQIQPPLRPNRLGNVHTPQPVAPDNNLLKPQDSQPVNLTSLPYPVTTSAFGSFEQLPRSEGSSDPQPGPSTSVGLMVPPSVEELQRLVRPSRTEPTLLFPPAVRAAGYSVPSPHEIHANGHSRHHSETSDLGKTNGDDRIQNARITSNDPLLPSVPPPSLPSTSVPQDLPSYTHARSGSGSRIGQSETLPPYSAPPQQQQHPHPYLHSDPDSQRAIDSRELALETTSSALSNFSPGLLTITTSSPWEAEPTTYTPFASSELLPCSAGLDRDRINR